MVIARSWAEQRVLMRAFAVSDDQTRPTIHLHGAELAIGPAGTDPHGEWGIHVEPPVDGRAQELREALQLAAKLLAGSKGNPPRLEDEVPEFEGRATNMWAPGTDRDEPPDKDSARSDGAASRSPRYEPAENALMSESPVIPSAAKHSAVDTAAAQDRAKVARTQFRRTPPFWGNTYETPELEQGTSNRSGAMPVPVAKPAGNASAADPETAPSKAKRNARQTFRYSGAMVVQAANSSRRPKPKAAKTVHGFARSEGNNKDTLATIAGKTMPLGLNLDESERLVLNTLGKQPYLTASQIGDLLSESDPMGWMARFMDKLAELGLDLVTPGDDHDGEATYVLPR